MANEVGSDKEKLIGTIDKAVTHLFEQILNYTEVVVSEDRYRRLRARILRLGNDCKRNLRKVVEKDYSVKLELGIEYINKLDRHKEKLIGTIDKAVTHLFEQILNYTEVVVSEDRHRRLRARILRLGNDCKRNLRKVVEKDYSVKFEARTEDFIEFSQKNSR